MGYNLEYEMNEELINNYKSLDELEHYYTKGSKQIYDQFGSNIMYINEKIIRNFMIFFIK